MSVALHDQDRVIADILAAHVETLTHTTQFVVKHGIFLA